MGWLHYATTGDGAYIEISPDGSMLTYPMPKLPALNTYLQVGGLAASDAGEVFVSARDVLAKKTPFSIFALDRTSGVWSPLDTHSSGIAGNFALLYGADGSDLVLRVPGDNISTLRFSPRSAERLVYSLLRGAPDGAKGLDTIGAPPLPDNVATPFPRCRLIGFSPDSSSRSRRSCSTPPGLGRLFISAS